MAELTDLKDLNRNAPVERRVERNDDAEEMHRHAEHEANKAARRAGEREHEDEGGQFSNIGPA